ncbi:hypothetical protein BT69DRAFT_1340429 [Atractiella rhizophila]|nr:hypothetical protein BT69DRAFT_1340429 [Atractiella rhizophila]
MRSNSSRSISAYHQVPTLGTTNPTSTRAFSSPYPPIRSRARKKKEEEEGVRAATRAALRVDAISTSGISFSFKTSTRHNPLRPRSVPYASKVHIKLQQPNRTMLVSDFQPHQLNATNIPPFENDVDQGCAPQEEGDTEMRDDGDRYRELREDDIEPLMASPEEEEEAYYNPNPDNAACPAGAGKLTYATPLFEVRDILMPLFDDGSDDLPTLPPTYHDEILKLTDKQQLTLDEFRVWHRGNEKDASYEGHYRNWTSRGHDMHTLPEAKKMLAELSRLDGEWNGCQCAELHAAPTWGSMRR